MQQADGNSGYSLTSQGQAVAGVQGSLVSTQRPPTWIAQRHSSAVDTGDELCVIGCCGLRLHLTRPRPTSH